MWYLIETLATEELPPTIVCKDGEPRDWSSIRRLWRDENVDLIELLGRARFTAKPTSQNMHGPHGDRRVDIDPIVGPEGATYGLHLWVGDPDQPVPPHRPAAGVRWQLGELNIRQGLDSWMMSTDDEDGFKRTRSPGEFFRKVVRFDEISDLIALAASPTPNTPFSTHLTVLHDRGYLMYWQGVCRAYQDGDESGARGITHDLTDTHPPSIGPLENLGLASEPDPEGPAAALLTFSPAVPTPLIAQWIGTPPSWVDWQREGDPELIHHDDWEALKRTPALLESGLPNATVTTPARIRSTNPSGWQPVTITSRRYPGEVGDRLHIIRITPTNQDK